MSGNYGPRMPLHVQNPEVTKAVKENPSWESFRPNVVHPMGTYGDDMSATHSTVADESRVRRNPNGALDAKHVANQIIDAIHKVEFNGGTGDPQIGSASLLPVDLAMLTVLFPGKYRFMEPQQAEILTKLSASEKEALRAFVAAHLGAEEGWNAGFGGGSVPGRLRRNVGG